MITGSGSELGPELIDRVDYVMFTGSTSVGKTVAKQAAERLVPSSMELGGKNAMIVMPDANLDLALEGALWGAFGTTGVHYGPGGATAYHSGAYGTSAYHTGADGTTGYHSGAYGSYGYHYSGGTYYGGYHYGGAVATPAYTGWGAAAAGAVVGAAATSAAYAAASTNYYPPPYYQPYPW